MANLLALNSQLASNISDRVYSLKHTILLAIRILFIIYYNNFIKWTAHNHTGAKRHIFNKHRIVIKFQ